MTWLLHKKTGPLLGRWIHSKPCLRDRQSNYPINDILCFSFPEFSVPSAVSQECDYGAFYVCPVFQKRKLYIFFYLFPKHASLNTLGFVLSLKNRSPPYWRHTADLYHAPPYWHHMADLYHSPPYWHHVIDLHASLTSFSLPLSSRCDVQLSFSGIFLLNTDKIVLELLLEFILRVFF